jgi:hypothetical protein
MAYLYEPSRDRHEEIQLDGVGTYPPNLKAILTKVRR